MKSQLAVVALDESGQVVDVTGGSLIFHLHYTAFFLGSLSSSGPVLMHPAPVRLFTSNQSSHNLWQALIIYSHLFGVNLGFDAIGVASSWLNGRVSELFKSGKKACRSLLVRACGLNLRETLEDMLMNWQ